MVLCACCDLFIYHIMLLLDLFSTFCNFKIKHLQEINCSAHAQNTVDVPVGRSANEKFKSY